MIFLLSSCSKREGNVVNSLTNDSDEQQFLLDNMLPKMLVGGFATVSIASVLIASFFLNML